MFTAGAELRWGSSLLTFNLYRVDFILELNDLLWALLIKSFHTWWSSSFVPHSHQSNLRDWLWARHNQGSTTNGKKVPCSRGRSCWQLPRTFPESIHQDICSPAPWSCQRGIGGQSGTERGDCSETTQTSTKWPQAGLGAIWPDFFERNHELCITCGILKLPLS